MKTKQEKQVFVKNERVKKKKKRRVLRSADYANKPEDILIRTLCTRRPGLINRVCDSYDRNYPTHQPNPNCDCEPELFQRFPHATPLRKAPLHWKVVLLARDL